MIPLAPVNDRTFIADAVRAGAEEFYLGFHDQAWHERFGAAADLNRMTGFGELANPYTFAEALDIVRDVRDLGKRVFVTFNANAYGRSQLDYLFGYFERLAASGASGVIVSVPEAAGPAADCGLEVVASTMCGVYNADIARAYRRLGCRRVIVPRDVSLDEIEGIAREVPDMELEVFLMRNGCIFSDGFCLGRHSRKGNSLCWDVRHAKRRFVFAGEGALPAEEVQGGSMLAALEANARAYVRFHRSTCGLCAIWRLSQANVAAAKIVGRSDDAACVLQDIRAVARNVAIAHECATEEEYLTCMEVPHHRMGTCEDGLSCYYPEVRFR